MLSKSEIPGESEPEKELIATARRQAEGLALTLSRLSETSKVTALNEARALLHEVSPFKSEPVDCVFWVLNTQVQSNSYNPNSVAKPEMALLSHSILSDGYTQPVVTYPVENSNEVIDGFHRFRVGREVEEVRNRVRGYLPIVRIRTDRASLTDRMASTIRHNRARGKHQVGAMSDIIVELARRKWSDERIGKELGMESDEVLRLKQVTGLADLFKDRSYSQAWEPVLE